MFVPKYFKAHEFIPPSIYKKWGERSFMFMDERVLNLADAIRKELGPLTVNNYYWGKDRKWSGLRNPDSPYYSQTSQHTFGRAADGILRDISTDDARAAIKSGAINNTLEELGCGLTLEDGVSWLHFDVRNSGFGVHSFKP